MIEGLLCKCWPWDNPCSWQPLAPGHFDSLIPGFHFGAVVFVVWIVAEYRKVMVGGKVVLMRLCTVLGRNLIVLLIWEISSKRQDIFFFK